MGVCSVTSCVVSRGCSNTLDWFIWWWTHSTTLPGLVGSFHLVPFPPPQLFLSFGCFGLLMIGRFSSSISQQLLQFYLILFGQLFSIIECVCHSLVKVGFHVSHAPTIQQHFNLGKRYLCSDHYCVKKDIYNIYELNPLWKEPILGSCKCIYNKVYVIRIKSEFVFTSTTALLSGKVTDICWSGGNLQIAGLLRAQEHPPE
jgi:hypothetical protein